MIKDQKKLAPWTRIKKELADAKTTINTLSSDNAILAKKAAALQQALNEQTNHADSYKATGAKLLKDLKFWEEQAKRPFWKRITKR